MPACVGVTLSRTFSRTLARIRLRGRALEMSEYLNTREKAVWCLMLSFHPVPVAR